MGLAVKSRDPETEQLERDAFTLLRHVHSVSRSDSGTELLASKLADAVGLERDYAFRAIRFLAREGLLHLDEAGPRVSLTVPGAAYVESLAWRRRSVRRRWS